MQVIKGCLLVPLNNGLNEDRLQDISGQILKRLQSTALRSVLIDVAAITVMSSNSFALLVNLVKKINTMGATAVIVGFTPGVAAALVDLDIDCSTILTAVTSDDALELIPSLETVTPPKNSSGENHGP